MGNVKKSSIEELFDGLHIPETETKESKVDEGKKKPTTAEAKKTVSAGKAKPTRQKLNKTQFLTRISVENLEKTRTLASNLSMPISDIIDGALEDFLQKYEKKHGVIKSERPRKVADLLK